MSDGDLLNYLYENQVLSTRYGHSMDSLLMMVTWERDYMVAETVKRIQKEVENANR